MKSHYVVGSYMKTSRKRLKHTGNLFRQNLRYNVAVNFRSAAIYIKGQSIAFCRQRIREFSYATKEIVDTDMLVTSRNHDKNTAQSIRITSRPPSRIRKRNQSNQFR